MTVVDTTSVSVQLTNETRRREPLVRPRPLNRAALEADVVGSESIDGESGRSSDAEVHDSGSHFAAVDDRRDICRRV